MSQNNLKSKVAPRVTTQRNLLDRILNDIFERELAAFATPPDENWHDTSAESPTAVQQDENDPENLEDAWSYETPRPWLSLQEAARMLGRSPRAVERSILGKWGNRLPSGWTGRRVNIDGLDEWRVVPPPGFKIKHNRRSTGTASKSEVSDSESDDEQYDLQPTITNQDEDLDMVAKTPADQSFTLEKFLQSATQIAQKELASFGLTVRSKKELKNARAFQSERFENGETTIVIDRSDEVEKLLRELSECHKELAQERRARLEEHKVMNELQSSLRLLEVNSRETRELKDDLVLAQAALKEHKRVYNEFLALPWWKRMFVK